MKSKKVAVCMIAKNCADIVGTSLAWATDNFNEVNVVVDPNNDDHTLQVIELWKTHPEINVTYYPFVNFSQQKNRAFDMATTPWVLSVDSDEIYECGIPWDKLVEGMDRSKYEVGAFQLYNLQKDLDHFKPPIEPKIRLIKKELAFMDGKEVDEGLQFNSLRVMMFPQAHIHFGHVRTTDALRLKGKDRIVFKDTDPCDGKGLTEHGEDWFVERNKEWNKTILECPNMVKNTIYEYHV